MTFGLFALGFLLALPLFIPLSDTRQRHLFKNVGVIAAEGLVFTKFAMLNLGLVAKQSASGIERSRFAVLPHGFPSAVMMPAGAR
jgi:hypothetical protein